MNLHPRNPGTRPTLERKARCAAHRLLDRVAKRIGDPDEKRIDWALRVTGDLPDPLHPDRSARAHLPSENLTPCPTPPSSTATGAKSDGCSCSASSGAPIGRSSFWREWVRLEALAQHAPFETTLQPSGDAATVGSRATGGEA